MFVSPSNSYNEILTPNTMVSGGEEFWRWLGQEGGSHMNGVTSFKKRSQRTFWPFCHVSTQREDGCLWRIRAPADPGSIDSMILGCPDSRTLRKKCLLWKPPSLCYFCYNIWRDKLWPKIPAITSPKIQTITFVSIGSECQELGKNYQLFYFFDPASTSGQPEKYALQSNHRKSFLFSWPAFGFFMQKSPVQTQLKPPPLFTAKLSHPSAYLGVSVKHKWWPTTSS